MNRPLPDEIHGYEMGKLLGEGTFAKVRLATSTASGEKVAVKVMDKSKIKSLHAEAKVKGEIVNLHKLRGHPNILHMHKAIDTPDKIVLVTEYASRGDLFDYVDSHGRLNSSHARKIFHQIISGVRYCHSQNVIHRDLKLENMLVDSELNIKIADFGFSVVSEENEFLQTSCGSVHYAAPEIVKGELYRGTLVDAWSCGVILYALRCSYLPFDDDSVPVICKQIRHGAYRLPGHLTETEKDLIQGLLTITPSNRMTVQDVCSHSWFNDKEPQVVEEARKQNSNGSDWKQRRPELDSTDKGQIRHQVKQGQGPRVLDPNIPPCNHPYAPTQRSRGLTVCSLDEDRHGAGTAESQDGWCRRQSFKNTIAQHILVGNTRNSRDLLQCSAFHKPSWCPTRLRFLKHVSQQVVLQRTGIASGDQTQGRRWFFPKSDGQYC